jgi:leucyl-tRNA synthetase
MGFADFNTMRNTLTDAQLSRRTGVAYTGAGFAVHSHTDDVSLDQLPVPEAKDRIIAHLEDRGAGSRRVNFRLRDWLFSRQRYWGEPFPIVFDGAGTHHGLAESALPVELPPLEDFKPIEADEPVPLLSKATDWVRTTAGDAGVPESELPPREHVTRETNTMPGWAGSCWYYLRYTDPRNADAFASDDAQRYWLGPTPHNPLGGVDLYIGGAEHATLHLLYARFWHKILFDLGHVDTPEPFAKLFHQGLILSHAFQRKDKSLAPIDQVDERDDGAFVERATGEHVQQVVAKMSKSLRNVVNPDDIIREFGADAFRLYEMYMGPLEANKPWSTRDLVGLYRFLQRAWRLVIDETTGEPVAFRDASDADAALEKQLHRTIAKVGDDIERLAFNTAIAAMIEFVNAASKAGVTRSQAERFVRTLCPFAPHIAEELWSRLGFNPPCSLATWPSHDPAMLRDHEVEIPVQLMGKVKARIMAPADADEKTLESHALAHPDVQRLIDGKTVRKVIVVPGRLVNIVAN